MYKDQATELRNLVQQHSIRRIDHAHAPRRIVVVGGKGRVGTSTIAVQLASILARQGKRVLLADADPRRGDLARLCSRTPIVSNPNSPAFETTATVESTKTESTTTDAAASEAPTVSGMTIVEAPWVNVTSEATPSKFSLADIRNFSRQLANPSDTEFVIADVGNGMSPVAKAFSTIADIVLVATTSDARSVTDSYALIKAILASDPPPHIATVVNQAATTNAAEDVFRRVDQSCQRFLGKTLTYAGSIPLDPLLANAGDEASLTGLRSSNSVAVRAMEQVSQMMNTSLR